MSGETSGDPKCRNLPLAFLDHCPDVAGKSTYSMVYLFDRTNVVRDAIEEECRFFERGRHSLPVGNFDGGNRPPAVGGPILAIPAGDLIRVYEEAQYYLNLRRLL
ncbi:hypothetical protein EVAR_99361_1 [Eumeta japonica]|uniref:Uncharacterized protein n=1 Tax=Eumeta variegata TaxID=151549 RepID=A0A4C1YLR1_EUMVA|nr:hypothetical protein EVAR_99361_1 [Eumeta japonica]